MKNSQKSSFDSSPDSKKTTKSKKLTKKQTQQLKAFTKLQKIINDNTPNESIMLQQRFFKCWSAWKDLIEFKPKQSLANRYRIDVNSLDKDATISRPSDLSDFMCLGSESMDSIVVRAPLIVP